ncbi:MAG: flagellar hook-associated protein FlgK [Hyphomicrobiaceae bacterium]|nr:flagellar hook-associated protein FlgK [Hyphomicrobiaceae bacterium]
MTLTTGLDVARSGLSAASGQTAVVSRNVAGAGDLLASRKLANIATLPGGGVRLASITRVSDGALLARMLAANATAGQHRTIVEALDRLDHTVADPELDASPAAVIGKLAGAIQLYSAAPHDVVAAQSAVAAARDVALALNGATETVQALRQQADADIASAVGRLNALVAQFESVNTTIVNGSRAGADVTDDLDDRDRLLLAISEEIGIRTMLRPDNDMVVFTDSGVTLFETKARAVTFEPVLIYTAATAGNPVSIDGVQVTGMPGGLVVGAGRLAGLTAVRDEIATAYQAQLDEIARGLIEAFAESDQSTVPALADAPGLFTYPGAPLVPAAGSLMTGLAGTIGVAAGADPAQGGDAALLRDGGMAGPAYGHNPTGAAGYSGRLLQILERMSEQRAFDPAAGLAPSATIAGFAASSVASLQEARQSASAEAEYRGALLERSSEALSNATGVNLDQEMANLLDLERSYQATSRIIATIDDMFRALLAMAG